jgi:DNA-binding response OmpR family regulator
VSVSGSEAPSRNTVFVVDDDVEVLAFVADVLDTEGYTVLRANDPREAFRLAQTRSDPIHLLLTDVVMPFMAGPDLAAHLRGRWPKVLLMSAFTSGVIEDHGIQVAPGEALLIKPFTIRQLLARLLQLAAKHRLPAIYGMREPVEADGLRSFGPSLPELFRRAAQLVNKILKGAKPADLPVEQATKFELVINMKTARALGLTIPPSLLQRADEVIQ